jgi:cysteinyl-tRNA synthetase
VTLYVCGPTVYNRAHIGNARPEVVFDTLFRLLRAIYGENHVTSVRNITDIDDKINAAALAEGVDISVITQKYTDIYRSDMKLLGVLPKTLEPKVTEHVEDIIAMIVMLEKKSHAYETADGVYFHVPSMPNYGRLSGRKLDEMQAGARVEIDENKRNSADFALWKKAKPNEPSWDSPWGRGRPGWHIECSAMIQKNLGLTIDIHGGGHDLIFPHHENEIAQSECAHGGVSLANIWMHNGMLNFGSDKMSKSLGNVLGIDQLALKWPAEALRLSLISAHYRAPLDWTDDLISQNVKTLDRAYRAMDEIWDKSIEPLLPESLLDVLCDDLNTPQALAELSTLVRNANKAKTTKEKEIALAELRGAGQLLGILQLEPKQWFANQIGQKDDNVTSHIDALVQERLKVRTEKNWARADEIRAELAALCVEVKDGPEGSTWRFTE